MKQFICLVFVLNSVLLFGQNTGTFYYNKRGEVSTKKEAKTKVVIEQLKATIYKETVNTKFESGWNDTNSFRIFILENDSTVFIQNFINNKLNGSHKRVFHLQNDTLFSVTDYENDTIVLRRAILSSFLPEVFEGKAYQYYPDGTIKLESVYQKNRLIGNQWWDKNGEKGVENLFEVSQVDIEPKFLKGDLMTFIRHELIYPRKAAEIGKSGKVRVLFTILEDGSIAHVAIWKSVHPLLDNEALMVVNLTNKQWQPSKIDNKPVKVSYNVPINFILQ